jgi:DNA-directed RNA polymerase II subunit RPB1
MPPTSAEQKQKQSMISAVEFSLFGPEEIARMSVCRVQEPTMYIQNLPAPRGVNDHRMGSVDRRLACGTCRRSVHDCSGHFGHIKFEFPVYHVGYIDLTLKILKTVCFFCSALLLSDANRAFLKKGNMARDRKKKISAAAAFAKTRRTCPSCGGCSPSYTRNGLSIRADFSKVTFLDQDEAVYCQRSFTSSEARIILQNIDGGDAALLGFDRPASLPDLLVMTSLVVPPPIIRPSVVISEGSKARGQDDLTSKLCDIVKANNSVKVLLEKETEAIPTAGLSLAAQQAVADLTFHVATLMNNDIRGLRPSYQRSGLPSKSITARLKGKEGRIRGSLMGKRVDFSARSVISPDPEMDVDEVGVPRRVAQILTVPERVTDYNMACLRARVAKGHGCLDGAHAIIRDGIIILLEFADIAREVSCLKVGEVVERYLENGDVVLFNRQPSLHKGSFMGFRVRIMPHSTFRINLACTPSLNADCDGDEMNTHVPQDSDAQTEARALMSVPNQIVSPQANKPCIGLVQDAVLGAYLLSHEDTRLNRRQMCELTSVLRYREQVLPEPRDNQRWTGRQALEMLLPEGLNYTNRKSTPPVVIRNGMIVSGRLCKHSLGTSYGSLVHRLWLEFGPDRCAHFLSDSQRLINRWLMWRGFSVRLCDCEPPKGVESKVQNLIRFGEEKIRKIESNYHIRLHVPAMVEQACSAIANRILTDVGRVVADSLDEGNALFQTVSCGSKGNLINVAQLIGAVGQQSLEGKRIDGSRTGSATLPAMEKDSIIRPKGFVKNSYFRGLDPAEFFFHSMAGREGLVDTAVKTANTGYLQRRLMKAMETLKVEYDGTVRNARENVIQFSYGADGYDAAFLVRHELPNEVHFSDFGTPNEAAAFFALSKATHRHHHRGSEEPSKTIYSPFRVDQALDASCFLEKNNCTLAAATIEEIVAETEGLYRRLARDTPSPWAGRRLAELHLRWCLRSTLILSKGISKETLFRACESLEEQARNAGASPGEMVGSIAAQSIGEPTTQLTLNTFHHAGVASKNVTLGVPRIKELIDCTRKIKTPVMRLVAKPSFQCGRGLHMLCTALSELSLGSIVESSSVVREDDYFGSCLGGLDHYVASRENLLQPVAPEDFNPFVLRLRLTPKLLIHRSLVPADVAEVIGEYLSGAAQITWSEPTMEEWFIRVRFLSSIQGAGDELHKATNEEVASKLCRDCMIGGIPNVMAVEETSGILITSGSNLRAILSVPELQNELCVSNDVNDVLKALGIEAAGRVLFDEISATLSWDGNYINARHIILLVSLMTSSGQLLAVSRHGLHRAEFGGSVLARCSFEETIDVLYDAAVYNEIDPVKGITERVVLGQRAAVGTGVCRVLTPHTAELDDDEDVHSDASSSEIIFTSVDAPIELLCSTSASTSNAVEMPFDTSGIAGPEAAPNQSSLRHSFIQPSSVPMNIEGVPNYSPSSPRRGSMSRKRLYEPSSPRLATASQKRRIEWP